MILDKTGSPVKQRTPAQLIDPRSDVREFGIFDDSLVSEITPWSVTENGERIPKYILPAYIGSGVLGITIDGSGMQILDCRLALSNRYHQGEENHLDDMYVFGEGLVSDHMRMMNLMPMGYLTYSIAIDGINLSEPDKIIAASSEWSREVDIRRGVVTTSFVLFHMVRVVLSCFSPYGTNRIVYQAAFHSVDSKPHWIVFSPEMKTIIRKERTGEFSGESIFDRVTASDAGACYAHLEGEVYKDGRFRPHHDYKLGYLVYAGRGSEYRANETGIGFERSMWTKPEAHLCFEFVAARLCYEDVTESSRESFKQRTEWFDNRLRMLKSGIADVSSEIETTKTAHVADWEAFYNAGGEVDLCDTKREMLFNNSLYLLRCGGTYENGLNICFLMFHPWCWHAATFWDLDFALDGLLKTNHVDIAKTSAAWLWRIMRKDGRPFPWVVLYDGASAMEKEWVDTGYHVNASHATSAIRLYETTRDRELLERVCYPIVRAVAVYATSDRFIKDGDVYIGAASAHDVNSQEIVNDTYSAAWFAVVLRKACEYAKFLRVDTEYAAAWEEILDGLSLERDDEVYHQHRGSGGPGNWISMLLYPTEAAPLLDMDAFRRSRIAQSFIHDYHSWGDTQPWVYFWQACSDIRLGDMRDNAASLIERGTKYVYGPGYFAEITPDSAGTVGMPPICTAHGAYLAAVTDQLFRGSIWDNEIYVFTDLPDEKLYSNISFNRLRTHNGVRANGEYSARGVEVTLDGNGAYRVRIRLPLSARDSNPRVMLDGVSLEDGSFEVDGESIVMNIELRGNPVKAEIR